MLKVKRRIIPFIILSVFALTHFSPFLLDSSAKDYYMESQREIEQSIHWLRKSTDVSGSVALHDDEPYVYFLRNPLENSPQADTIPPVIDVWFGTNQVFGQIGTPQQWINILGNVSDASGINSLTYTLNGVPGSPPLSLGPDNRRLGDAGDFNIEIDKANLNDGNNTVVITASDNGGNGGNVATETVNVEYHPDNQWYLPYSIDWSTVSNAQEVAQIVDGDWSWDINGVRTKQVWYDRLIAIGEMGWDDYEVVVPITIHSVDEIAYSSDQSGHHAAVGIILRWQGHTDNPVICSQPHCGWLPLGSINWYEWRQDPDPNRLRLITEPDGSVVTTGIQLVIGNTYWFKARAETNASGTHYYFKVWQDGEAEPGNWTLDKQATSAENLSNGSFLFVAHHVDATFGDVSVTSLDSTSYSLTNNKIGSGTVTKDPNQSTFYKWQKVTLTASPDNGWTFTNWSGALTGSDNPETLTIIGDHTVTATFTQNEYTLDVSLIGDGSVTLSPEKETYTYGEEVTLTSNASEDWSFAEWSGDLSGSDNPETLTIIGDHTVTATFLPEYTLDVNNNGNGTVTLDPPGGTYIQDTVVTMRATADPGWTFTNWSGTITGSENPRTLTMKADHAITANFSQDDYVLTVNMLGSGSVEIDPDQMTYHYGDDVELTASTDTGWTFIVWSGALSSTDNPETLMITGDQTVTALFAQDEYVLTVNMIGDGSINVEPDKTIYHYGDIVTLTASADPGWSFTNWSGDLTGSDNPQTLELTGNATVTANFFMGTDLSITISDNADNIYSGQPTSYVITVYNNGGITAEGAVLTNHVPISITNVVWECNPLNGSLCGTSSGTGNNIFDSVTLAAGSKVIYTVYGTISPWASGTLSNQASISIPTGLTDPIPDNNTATDTTSVLQSLWDNQILLPMIAK